MIGIRTRAARIAITAALGLIIYTGYRMSTRSIRFASIDNEVNLGYATDRWGFGPDGTFDAGIVWGDQQKQLDDDHTRFLQLASVVATVMLVVFLAKPWRRRIAGERWRLR